MNKRNKKKMIKSLWRAGAIGYDKASDTCFIVAKVIGKIEIGKKSRIGNVCRINPLHLSDGTPSHVTDYENCRLATQREKDRYFALMYDYFDRNKELAYDTEIY